MGLILRNVKGDSLTYTEMDGNLTYLESLTGSLVSTASFNAYTASLGSGSFSGSFTGSFGGVFNGTFSGSIDPFPYTGSAVITGSLVVTGSLETTDKLTVQSGATITASVASPFELIDDYGAMLKTRDANGNWFLANYGYTLENSSYINDYISVGNVYSSSLILVNFGSVKTFDNATDTWTFGDYGDFVNTSIIFSVGRNNNYYNSSDINVFGAYNVVTSSTNTTIVGNYNTVDSKNNLFVLGNNNLNLIVDGTTGNVSMTGSLSNGTDTVTIGQSSHAEGIGTITSGSYQHASGFYNTHNNTSSIFIIGNGVDDANRSDLALFDSQSITFNAPVTASYFVGTASYAANAASADGTDTAITALVATTANIASVTYSNGTNGVGATLTRTVNGSINPFQGQTLLTGSRILLISQSSGIQNGVYSLTQTGSATAPYILTRTTDSDVSGELDGQVVVITTGSLQGTFFTQTVAFPTVGSSLLIYSTLTTESRVIYQSTTGTQTQNNIPYYTGASTSRTLSKGSTNFTYDGTTLSLFSSFRHGPNVASGTNSHAEGRFTTASGQYAHSEGGNARALGSYSHAEGSLTIASGSYSHAEGTSTVALGQSSHAEGQYATASGVYSHAEGGQTVAFGDYAHAEGYQTVASGAYSHAEGSYTQAKGDYSHAEGAGTIASSSYSHAEGTGTQALGDGSHSEGEDAQAVGQGSHAEGFNTMSSGSYSHAEGLNTIASGLYSHTEGDSTQAIGYSSHAEGNSTISSGSYSHAEGEQTQAIGEYSHAEGVGSQAIGYGSHVEGYYTIATGDYSHAEGNSTVASGSYQHVQGMFNISSSGEGAFIIGNGVDDSTRSNLVYASGSVFEVTGSLKVTGSNGDGGFYLDGNRQFNYISAVHTASITVPGANTSGSFIFNDPDGHEGINLVSSSRFYFSYTGVYNIQFSAQLFTPTAATVHIWFKENGSNIAESGTRLGPTSNNDYLVPAWNYVKSFSSGSYIEIAYQSTQANTEFSYVAATGNIPAIPSIIATITQVR